MPDQTEDDYKPPVSEEEPFNADGEEAVAEEQRTADPQDKADVQTEARKALAEAVAEALDAGFSDSDIRVFVGDNLDRKSVV